MSKGLYKFHWNCGRSGDVESVFISTGEDVKWIVGQEVYFGEILGKHSEVYGKIEEGDITKLEVSEDAIKELEGTLGTTWSGYNPFDYLSLETSCPKCNAMIDSDEVLNWRKGIAKCWKCKHKFNFKELIDDE